MVGNHGHNKHNDRWQRNDPTIDHKVRFLFDQTAHLSYSQLKSYCNALLCTNVVYNELLEKTKVYFHGHEQNIFYSKRSKVALAFY